MLTISNQDPIDSSLFSPGPYDHFRFSPSLVPAGTDMNAAATPMGMIQSTDGLGNDGMEFLHSDAGGGEFLSERRSSSEEKESLTPAQSRRKAQNRAA